jgi:hypothetical protein
MSENKTTRVMARDLSAIEFELHRAMKFQAANNVVIGGLLREAKKALKHGEWGVWLLDHFALSERTAQHYMAASEFAAKYANFADFKLRLTGIYELTKHDQKTVAAVLEVSKTKWLAREGVDTVAEEFLQSENARLEAEERKAQKAAEEPMNTITAEQDGALAGEGQESGTIFDALPELPPTAAPAPIPFDELLTSRFSQAVTMLKGMLTKPAANFANVDYSAANLELVANFLNQIAAAKQSAA